MAQDRESGEWTAIQCKFYAPHQYLAKEDIDSFFTASGKKWDGVAFTNRIIISTTDKWSTHAESALEDQTIPVQRIGLADIAESPIDWAFADPKHPLEVNLSRAAKFTTRPHQDQAIAAIRDGFTQGTRGSGSRRVALARPSPR
ncbi:restriction endonuclease [Tessaracoccus coleopterorum]|uniref:restriction endonuclease n=1 Tax=Tessaracoccus coleopterorum TaxID=2714950 RepID=UPI002F90E617